MSKVAERDFSSAVFSSLRAFRVSIAASISGSFRVRLGRALLRVELGKSGWRKGEDVDGAERRTAVALCSAAVGSKDDNGVVRGRRGRGRWWHCRQLHGGVRFSWLGFEGVFVQSEMKCVNERGGLFKRHRRRRGATLATAVCGSGDGRGGARVGVRLGGKNSTLSARRKMKLFGVGWGFKHPTTTVLYNRCRTGVLKNHTTTIVKEPSSYGL